ncbi:MAG: transketolase C-terminal domain-containing protein [Bacillota bacterium]|nr:transketolase C-terminal domain-containing protein [Bacillota bacterium]
MRRSFRTILIDAIMKNAKDNPQVVVLNADSARALCLTKFGESYPDRMFSLGISEADMLATAAGMSTTGLIPIVVGFSMFVTEKPFEQIRQAIAYPNLNVKIIATHAGLCVGKDGATHQALEDIAVMRVLPNFKVFVAADVSQTESAIDSMILHEGPAYLRLGRDLAEDIYSEPKSIVPGGSDTLTEGMDVTIVACGLMVEQALKAADELKNMGVSASVINAYSVKPLDENTIISSARITGAVVSAEDHSVIGGLGSAIAETLVKNYPVPMEFIGVNDHFGESGDQDELYKKYGLTHKNIVEASLKAINRKV